MEEGEKEYAYLQDELGSTIRFLEQGGESQDIYGYDEFGEDTYGTQGHLQPFGYTIMQLTHTLHRQESMWQELAGLQERIG